MPPTWNSGIMLKHTSVALRPQDAITHTAPTASVSRVYATVFFLPLHAMPYSVQGCWLVLSALQPTLTFCEVESKRYPARWRAQHLKSGHSCAQPGLQQQTQTCAGAPMLLRD